MRVKYTQPHPRPVCVSIDRRVLMNQLASLAAALGLRLHWSPKARRLHLEARP